MGAGSDQNPADRGIPGGFRRIWGVFQICGELPAADAGGMGKSRQKMDGERFAGRAGNVESPAV